LNVRTVYVGKPPKPKARTDSSKVGARADLTPLRA